MLDPKVQAAAGALGVEYEVIDCDPDFADTAAFCARYGYAPEDSANTILVASKRPVGKFAACVILATSRLDVNHKVCDLLEVKNASFASPDQTKELTGMLIGGVTAFGLPPTLPLYIDAQIMLRPKVILGGGNRESKLLIQPRELLKTGALVVPLATSI
jgi:prolyl-tRNA editing enzyme YbaK/EbsC (Cys-tRNA(Pro) deacylase)